MDQHLSHNASAAGPVRAFSEEEAWTALTAVARGRSDAVGIVL